jgi:hypothetical protein
MREPTLVLPSRDIWPCLSQPGYRERCEAILEAITWITEGEDVPSVIELVFLANDQNWLAAHGDPYAIASAWAIRDFVRQATDP